MTDIRHADALRIALQTVEAAQNADDLFVANEALYAASKALLTACVVVDPQDMEWGDCPGNDSGPHAISTSLCVYCLEYDPE